MTSVARPDAKPFLKWAGGKRQLLPHLRRFYPDRFGAYIEPFLGSAAVFFDLRSRGLLDGHTVRLSDSNADLIACYGEVRDRIEEVIAELERLETGHRTAPKPHYYEVRDERFNQLRREARADARPTPAGASDLAPDTTPIASPARTPGRAERKRVDLAAMFIYLNRTGYNGLFRVNASGDFNVPAGRYERPRICDAATLRAASAALAGASLAIATFSDALSGAREGDFVYLDPPYAPLTRTARFTAYTALGFGSADQHRLHAAVLDLARRGVQVVLSNSAADEVKALYADDPAVRRAGLCAHRVPARRAINSRASQRGSVEEYVITNIGC